MFLNDDVPLRSVLRHGCVKLLTAGKSKGEMNQKRLLEIEQPLQIMVENPTSTRDGS